MTIEITTLIENKKGEHLGLFNEHGISFYIKKDNEAILFDTGQSDKFLKNAEQLGVDLSNIKQIILSHGHYDHTGGFIHLVEKLGNSFSLNISKCFFDKKYGFNGLAYEYLGNNFDETYLKKKEISVNYIEKDMVEITNDIYLFSNFEQICDYEEINSRFRKLVNNEFVVDKFQDEVVVGVKTEKGLLVILGCCHSGVVNILETITKRSGESIYGIIGGTHLVEANNKRIVHTLEYFEEKDIKILGISHCTGEKAIKELKKYEDKFFYNSTGTSLILE